MSDTASRHTMSRETLNDLYRKLENFLADLTPEEAQSSKASFTEIFTLIHQRIRQTK
nr:MAG TPA: hypothetical protein [Caudoviricetes sp.]